MQSKEYHNKKFKNSIKINDFKCGQFNLKSLNEDVMIVEENKIKSSGDNDDKLMDSLENKVKDKQSKLLYGTPEIKNLKNLSEINKTNGIFIKLFCILSALNI